MTSRALGLRRGAVVLWRRLRGGALTPWRAGGSIGVGLFIGALPIYGAHFPLCLLLCLPLRLDVVVAYLAACFNNPLTGPLLLVLEVEVGSLLLTGQATAFDIARAKEIGLGGFVWHAVLGSFVVGSVLAVAGAIVAFVVAGTRAARRHDSIDEAIERTVGHYENARPADRWYVAAKLRGDPVVRKLARLGDLGDVVDLGCGRGQLALFLSEANLARTCVGVDWDERKVAVANEAARSLPREAATRAERPRFEAADVRNAQVPEADTILLIDVLHYLSCEEQNALIDRACRAARAGGRIIVREADGRRTGRAFATRLPEWIGLVVRFNRGSRIAMRPLDELVGVIESHGLECSTDAKSEGVPLANALIIAQAGPLAEAGGS